MGLRRALWFGSNTAVPELLGGSGGVMGTKKGAGTRPCKGQPVAVWPEPITVQFCRLVESCPFLTRLLPQDARLRKKGQRLWHSRVFCQRELHRYVTKLYHQITIFLLIGLRLSAQTPAYLHYGVRDGLPSNLIYCGLQDQDGLLWFATDKGLARFDGSRFRTYDMSDGLPDSEVFYLKTDSRKRLWMFCYQKQPCYRQNGRIVTAQMDSLLARIDFETAIGDLTEDYKGQIWLSSFSNRFYVLTDSSIHRVPHVDAVNKACSFPEGLIAATGNSGVYYFITPDGKSELRHNEPALAIAKKFISFEKRGKHILWSTESGLFLTEFHNGDLHIIDSQPGPTGRIYVDKSNRFWVCSLAGGAVCFDNARQDLSNPVLYLPGKKVTTFFEDHQGTFWFCTAGEGVYALPRNSPVNYGRIEGLLARNITAVARDASGTILAGNDEGKMYLISPSKPVETVDYGSIDGYNRIRQIVPMPDGGRWVVTDEELYYESAAQTPGSTPRRYKSPIVLGHPKGIYARTDQVILATSSRLYRIDGIFQDTANLLSLRKTAVSADDDNNVWAGGIDELFSERDGYQTNWSKKFDLLNSRIVALAPAGPGYLWVVTPENGLIRASVLNGAIIDAEVVSHKLKTPIHNIQALYPEPGGRLWMATNQGIFGLDSEWHVIHFDAHDGLADDDVNAVYVYKDTLWAATANGLSRMVLRPPEASRAFATRITALRYRYDDQHIALDLLDSMPAGGSIYLPPDASLVQLELAGLDYRGRGNLHFLCRQTAVAPPILDWTLDHLIVWLWQGFQAHTDTTVVEEAIISFGVHLPPGAYRLQVSAINAAGVVSDQPASLTIVMRPYWYQTIWVGLLFWSAIIYFLWRIYKGRLAYRDLNASVSTLQLQALQAQINPHFVGNSINAIQQFFYPPDPVRASEYISTFTGLLRRTLLFSEKHFIPFREEIAYDRDYLQLIELRFGDRFQFEIIGSDQVPYDTPFPCMLLQTLLENATIHGLAPEGISVLRLEFVWQDLKLHCSVTDNGVGIDTSLARKKTAGPTERKSKGLEMLGKKIETLNRLYDIDLEYRLDDLGSLHPGDPNIHGTRAIVMFLPGKVSEKAYSKANSEPVPPNTSVT